MKKDDEVMMKKKNDIDIIEKKVEEDTIEKDNFDMTLNWLCEEKEKEDDFNRH